jgi:putative ATP-dependent endonuclease of OLD family
MNLGLGTINRLFMATELIHLSRTDYSGLNLALIEELEAHLHPQAQMQVIEKLQMESGKQLILTTHSPNLTSKVKLNNLIICNNDNAYPMGNEYTKLEKTDYKFLERFLDTTKANLFFAKGVILVEGWAEEILIPTLAKKLGYDLTVKQVSVVNIANTAFMRYVKIFQREKESEKLGINVSVITDLDLRPIEYEQTPWFQEKLEKHLELEIVKPGFVDEDVTKNAYLKKHNLSSAYTIADELASKKQKYEDSNTPNVKAYISEAWTLEYCLAQSELLRQMFFKAVLLAHKEQKEHDGVQTLTKYDEAIASTEHFNSWSEKASKIAFEIYWQILGEENYVGTANDKISKSIIAQHFAQLLEDDTSITTEQLKAEPSLKYLVEAIEHACR